MTVYSLNGQGSTAQNGTIHHARQNDISYVKHPKVFHESAIHYFLVLLLECKKIKLASNIHLFIKVLQHASIIPECGKLGVPPITPTTFEDYVIPFWFRESVFRQDANLGFLSNQKKSTQNTGVV